MHPAPPIRDFPNQRHCLYWCNPCRYLILPDRCRLRGVLLVSRDKDTRLPWLGPWCAIGSGTSISTPVSEIQNTLKKLVHFEVYAPLDRRQGLAINIHWKRDRAHEGRHRCYLLASRLLTTVGYKVVAKCRIPYIVYIRDSERYWLPTIFLGVLGDGVAWRTSPRGPMMLLGRGMWPHLVSCSMSSRLPRASWTELEFWTAQGNRS
jgi:hypothetical protein